MNNYLNLIETELKDKFNSNAQNWIDYLETTYDTAKSNKQYDKCFLINELLSKELEKMY